MADLTGVTWRKSSRSQGANNCVEVGRSGSVVGVRDTKDRRDTLVFSTADWGRFTAFLRRQG